MKSHQTRSREFALPQAAFFLLTLIPLLSAKAQFFSEPDAPFFISPQEQVVRVELPLAAAPELGLLENLMGKKARRVVAAETAQAVIDAARAANPDAFLVIQTPSPIEVGASPLRLGSKMRLSISQDAGIVASPDITATALIALDNAEDVLIASEGPGAGLIDGGGKSVTGILIAGGARINLDRLAVTGCGVAAIDYKGRDAVAFNQAASATRCHFSGNADGLRVDETAAFQCLDNVFSKNTGTALVITSINSIVAGNDFKGNTAAIRSSSDRGVIARNKIADKAALELTAASQGTLVTENIGRATDHQLVLAGSTQQLFRNDLQGTATLSPDAKDIFLVGNAGLSVDPAATGLKFFNPPTYRHPHKDPLIVSGMGRFDMPDILGGKNKKGNEEGTPPVDIAVVQEALNAASQEHPNDVLVLKLQGEFVSKSLAGLELPPNTCLILDGRILADVGLPLDPPWVRGEPVGQVVMIPKTGYSSVSGGKLDGGRQVNHSVNAYKGSVCVLENVNITASSRDGINTKARNKDHPMFIYRCNVYGNNARGVWAHVATRVHSIANNCIGNNTDGIDLDAHAIDCTALFNVCTGNRRHGVFIEEGVDHNIVFGNILNDNFAAGIHVWNEEVKQNTGPNVISANECNGNYRGTSVGGRADDKTSHDNLFFNNVTRYNRLNGILAGNSKAKGNYFTQCVIGQNIQNDIAPHADAIFFNAVDPANP